MIRSPRTEKSIMMGGRELMEAPNFITNSGNEKLVALTNDLLRTTRELRVLLGQFYLYSALTRSKSFGALCDESDAVEGVHIIIGSLLRTMVVSSAALFDEDQRTSNIKKIIRGVLSNSHIIVLQKIHEEHGSIEKFERALKVSEKYQKKIKQGKYKQSIISITHVRRTFVAHFDAHPAQDPNRKRSMIRDLVRVIAAASFVLSELNYVVLGREVDISRLREMLRRDARGVVATLTRGFRSADEVG